MRLLKLNEKLKQVHQHVIARIGESRLHAETMKKSVEEWNRFAQNQRHCLPDERACAKAHEAGSEDASIVSQISVHTVWGCGG
ncbi:MAG: hypothetical protein ACLR23_07955 [Clostridia bacterium]